MSLKLGYKAAAEQFAARELVELAVAAEEHGMDSATVSDHFQPWRHEGGHAPFSLAWMTAVGEGTERLPLGTPALAPRLPYTPARRARLAAAPFVQAPVFRSDRRAGRRGFPRKGSPAPGPIFRGGPGRGCSGRS